MSEPIRLKGNQLRLGEGVIWDEKRGCIHYVDIEGHCIYTCRTDGEILHTLHTHDCVGCIVPDGEGNICYPMPDGLYVYTPETGSSRREYVWSIPGEVRFNDGKCDAAGALFVGTMYRDQSDPRAKGGGSLYRFTPADGLTVVQTGLTIPNGLAWREDNRIMYHIDTGANVIRAYEYDLSSHSMQRLLHELHIPAECGGPDGMTIDKAGCLWSAQWGGFSVIQWNAETGETMAKVPVPDANVSCCTFGGKDMRTLFITTAMDENGSGGYVYSCQTQSSSLAPYPLIH